MVEQLPVKETVRGSTPFVPANLKMKITHFINDATPHTDTFGCPITVGCVVVYNNAYSGTFLKKAVVVGYTKERIKIIPVDFDFTQLNCRDTVRVINYSVCTVKQDMVSAIAPSNTAVMPDIIQGEVIRWFGA